MNSTKKTARIAGLLYLVNGVTGFFGIIYVPSRLIVSGNTGCNRQQHPRFREAFPPRHRLGTDLRGRICLPALGSLPINRRREQDACFADGDPGSGLRSHYVPEYAKRDRCPDALTRRRFPVGIRQTSAGGPGHAVPGFASLRVRCRLDLGPLALPLPI